MGVTAVGPFSNQISRLFLGETVVQSTQLHLRFLQVNIFCKNTKMCFYFFLLGSTTNNQFSKPPFSVEL